MVHNSTIGPTVRELPPIVANLLSKERLDTSNFTPLPSQPELENNELDVIVKTDRVITAFISRRKSIKIV